MIPKIIHTAWFPTLETLPDNLHTCIESQKLKGYTHNLITLDNCLRDHEYIQQCLNSTHNPKKWVKLTDFLRMYYLYKYGGFFIDADVEIIQDKNFDALLENQMVVGLEGNGTIPNSIIIGSAIVGAQPNNPIIKKWINRVVSNFRGDDDLCYESSMDILNLLCLENLDSVTIVSPDHFYPYNHHTGITNITDNTICIHHFNKSWILPTLAVIIPQLGREEGLKKCVESIRQSNYPQDLINIYIIEGSNTVPNKVKTGVEQSTESYIVYAANDMTFDKNCLRNAVEASLKFDKALVSFNEGAILPDQGNICTHFLIRRDFIDKIGGEVFDTSLKHRGVDNILWKKCEKLNQALWCEFAKIDHRHFSKGYTFDSIYEKGWHSSEEELQLVKDKLSNI